MKKFTTLKLSICLLLAFSCLSTLFVSCEKINGHVISTSTPIVKSGTLTFTLNDTTHTLATTIDTVSFNTTTAPVTTITAKNGQKTLSFVMSFNADIAGTYTISALTIIIPQTNGSLQTSTQNTGSITVDNFNVYGGLISGSFTSTVPISKTASTSVTGTFSIQQ